MIKINVRSNSTRAHIPPSSACIKKMRLEHGLGNRLSPAWPNAKHFRLMLRQESLSESERGESELAPNNIIIINRHIHVRCYVSLSTDVELDKANVIHALGIMID